jgi:hypothetical protein
VGGLFLAFPSIFPAAASLVESHEKKKKGRVGLDGETRGRQRRLLTPQARRLEASGL